MRDEEEYVVQTFDRSFSGMKTTPMAIYGLGNNTKKILEALPEYRIVGLLDPVRIGDCVFGHRVLALEELPALQCRDIVIVARYAVQKIIYRRIEAFCKAHAIRVFDINGNDLTVEKTFAGLPAEYETLHAEILRQQIEVHDVISFDIFDTLLMRDTLYPRDVFELLEETLEQEGMGCADFAQKRARAEDTLNGTGCPTLSQVYETLARQENVPQAKAALWMQREIHLEKQHLLPRCDMRALFAYAQQLGKTVVLTSDMYLSATVLADILQAKGYDVTEAQILVSCEWQCTKAQGLFRILCKKYPGKTILHIGDNLEADKKGAERCGLDGLYIPSAYQMIEDSAFSFLLDHLATRRDRDLVGRFAARYLNSPFAFEKTGGKLRIDREEDLGYYFLAPLMQSFVSWMVRRANALGLEKLLLGARDGYLPEKVLQTLERKGFADIPAHQYFYISRQAAVLASLRTKEDILAAAELPFSGNMRTRLEKRFELSPEQIQPLQPQEQEEAYLLRHTQVILAVAERRRQAFGAYLRQAGLEPGHRYGFMDFVSSGTCQRYLQVLAGLDLTGLYLLKNESAKNQAMQIESAYGQSNVFTRDYAVIDVYFLLEKVVTSFEPTLQRFEGQGAPVFMPECRTAAQLEALRRIQQGVLDSVEEIRTPEDLSENIPLADDFLKLLESDYSEVAIDFVTKTELADEFSNRTMQVAL